MPRLLTLLLTAAAVLLLAPAALAAQFGEVADALANEGVYVEPGAEEVDRDALEEAADDPDTDLSVAVLADSPAGGEEALAADLVDEVGGTVLVFSPATLWAESAVYEEDVTLSALDAADAEVGAGGDPGDYGLAFEQALEEGGSGDGGGGFGSLGLLLVGGGAAALGGLALFRSSRRRRDARQAQERSLEEARTEVRAQVAALAEQIVTFSDRVALSGNNAAQDLFNEASQTYQQAQATLEQSDSPEALERVSDQLDHARWQLESVAALLDGREPPPKPEREEACFFDPTHGAGTEEAVIETPAGNRTVRVCAADAAKLRAGQTPEPRMIDVGGQRVPAAMAPRSYGGGGLGWLDDFVLVMGPGRSPFGWGGYRGGYGRGWGGGYGPGWSGGWGGPAWDSPWGGGYGGGYDDRSRRRSSGWGGGFGGGGAVSRGGSGRSRSSGGGRSRSLSSRSSGGRSRGGGGRSRGGGGRRR